MLKNSIGIGGARDGEILGSGGKNKSEVLEVELPDEEGGELHGFFKKGRGKVENEAEAGARFGEGDPEEGMAEIGHTSTGGPGNQAGGIAVGIFAEMAEFLGAGEAIAAQLAQERIEDFFLSGGGLNGGVKGSGKGDAQASTANGKAKRKTGVKAHFKRGRPTAAGEVKGQGRGYLRIGRDSGEKDAGVGRDFDFEGKAGESGLMVA